MENFKFFGLNLGELPNYVRYFGSDNVKSVAESWVEEVDGARWRWVHGLVIPFTQYESPLQLKVSSICFLPSTLFSVSRNLKIGSRRLC